MWPHPSWSVAPERRRDSVRFSGGVILSDSVRREMRWLFWGRFGFRKHVMVVFLLLLIEEKCDNVRILFLAFV